MTLDAKILSTLRGAGDGCVSGAELSHQLGISRTAVWARIQELRSLGYEIEASPHHGCRLRAVPDVLHADDLMSLVNGNHIIGRDIQVFQETNSTNDVVERLARDGVAEGAVVFAETQKRGRGRLGRHWVSPPRKGLWFSVLLRPNLQPPQATQLTVAAATALARTIHEHCGLQPSVKWPNDILLQDRKVAGVLTELAAEIDCIRYVILGIGINVNFSPSDFPAELRAVATSLQIEAGHAFRRAELAAALLRELDRDYDRVRRREFGRVADEWAAHCATLGQRVRIRIGDRAVTGRAEALDDAGALLLRTDHGHLERIVGGDVTLEK
ncbi:MAG: biotin--[acetyl-CoA-carboxylase] ligase [Verrucomicrobia subdivision 3 bacterium]|nr:biotin--[acetyl-CoA-carboxylase] ligase [Limisphaerales bacterium]